MLHPIRIARHALPLATLSCLALALASCSGSSLSERPSDDDAYERVADRDGDGIANEHDTCPDIPEDWDGFEDENGCPELDNDQDTIVDFDDMCPNDPEDFDWFNDEDGCPDLDNDADRVLDVDDQCPDDPEDLDGYDDEDGCPESGFDFRYCVVEILDRVPFDENDSDLSDEGHAVIADLAAALSANPDVLSVRVEGHADPGETHDDLATLGAERAALVMAALIEAGVSPERLSSAGFGADRPLTGGTTTEERAMNRRVEFEIVEVENPGQCP